jgi:hypothetical protein
MSNHILYDVTKRLSLGYTFAITTVVEDIFDFRHLGCGNYMESPEHGDETMLYRGRLHIEDDKNNVISNDIIYGFGQFTAKRKDGTFVPCLAIKTANDGIYILAGIDDKFVNHIKGMRADTLDPDSTKELVDEVMANA